MDELFRQQQIIEKMNKEPEEVECHRRIHM